MPHELDEEVYIERGQSGFLHGKEYGREVDDCPPSLPGEMTGFTNEHEDVHRGVEDDDYDGDEIELATVDYEVQTGDEYEGETHGFGDPADGLDPGEGFAVADAREISEVEEDCYHEDAPGGNQYRPMAA